MKREDRFLISHAPYAVEPQSLITVERPRMKHKDGQWTVDDTVPPFWSCEIRAAWFKRKSGVLMACMGTLHTIVVDKPTDYADFLTQYADGRYGGDCAARWDGTELWSPETDWDAMVERQKFLAQMLSNYPNIPDSYDGWWTFHA